METGRAHTCEEGLRFAPLGQRWRVIALLVCGTGCSGQTEFDERREELSRQIGPDAEVCPSVDEDFPCDPDGPEGHRCIAEALQACQPAELRSFDDDSEEYWFVVDAGESCELIRLSLHPGVVAEGRLRFTEQTCGSIEAQPSESGSCTTFTPLDCQ